MKYYKALLLLVSSIMLFTTQLFSQNIGNRQNNSQTNQTGKSQFSPEKIKLFVFYDSDVIIKKIKLKDKAKKAKLSNLIESYNDKMTEIKAFDSGVLLMAKTYLAQRIKEAKQDHDPYIVKEGQIKTKEILGPLRKKIKMQRVFLNTELKKFLTDKQYNKWLKYQKRKSVTTNKKMSTKPQMKMRGQRQSQGQNRRY
ncbi:MAG: hypothetical protein L3J45_10340 [Flavobacteriaceae bacterium]|nr:hypothetical protein [Flavobacteriaceae bacterium]